MVCANMSLNYYDVCRVHEGRVLVISIGLSKSNNIISMSNSYLTIIY